MKLLDKVKITGIGLATGGVIACSVVTMHYTSCEYASKFPKLQAELDSIKHTPAVANYLDANQKLNNLPVMHYFESHVQEKNFNKSVQIEKESLQKIIDETPLSPISSYQHKLRELGELKKRHTDDYTLFIDVSLLSFMLGGFWISEILSKSERSVEKS